MYNGNRERTGPTDHDVPGGRGLPALALALLALDTGVILLPSSAYLTSTACLLDCMQVSPGPPGCETRAACRLAEYAQINCRTLARPLSALEAAWLRNASSAQILDAAYLRWHAIWTVRCGQSLRIPYESTYIPV